MITDSVVDTDVLIVGGGGAGYRAAVAAREKGASATLACKGPLARCGATPLAGADLTVDGKSLRELGFPGEPRDSKETFFSDVVHQGFFLNNQKLVEIYMETAPDRLRELIEWGIKLERHSEQRAVYTSGTQIVDTVRKRARRLGVNELADMMIIDLFTKDGAVTGALGLDINSGRFVTFRAKAVVLAAGGWHRAYWPNTGTRELSGDGPAMAYRAGAQVANMEFVTFAANILLWPPRWTGSLFTYILHMGIGGELVNSEGINLLGSYDPYVVQVGTSTEWNKCFISLASAREVGAGRGSPHGGVYYQLGDVPWQEFDKRVVSRYPRWKFKGADYSELGHMLRDGMPVEVGPVVEYFEGGTVVNERFETTVPGLYAAGECTSSLFGANRVAAATTEMLVEGAIAGWNAAQYANALGEVEVDQEQVDGLKDKALQPLRRREGTSPVQLRRRLQQLAHERLGPIRQGEELEQLVTFLDRSKTVGLPALYAVSPSRRYNKEWIEALQLENMVQVLELSAQAALARTESRGVHYRTDHPHTDNDNWLRETAFMQVGGQPVMTSRPITVTSLQPPDGITPYMDMLKRMMEAHSDVGGHH